MSNRHSAIKFRLLIPELNQQYDDFVASQSAASIYHTRYWMAFLEDAFRVHPKTLLVMHREEVVGVIPLAIQRSLVGSSKTISLPYSHRVNCLIEDEMHTQVWQYLKQKFGSQLEIRGALQTAGKEYYTGMVNTTVSLTHDLSAVQNRVKKNTWQQLQQGQRNQDLWIKDACDPEDFVAMDQIMAQNRRALQSLTYPRGFFAKLYKHLGKHVHLKIAVYQQKPIALFAATFYGQQAIYHYGASLADQALRKVRPNNVLYWDAITSAANAGVTTFDFGTSQAKQSGLIKYKESWGGETTPLFYTRAEIQNPRVSQDSRLADVAGLLISKLPLSFYQTMTPYLLREFG